MGRINEDVFPCEICEETIVYEPSLEFRVKCDYCNAEYLIERTVKITLLSKVKIHKERGMKNERII
ncbi:MULTISPECIES: hypothetical protein [Bacillus amyloliquefaciens group]|uniref:hypothetical protein n=1 Tax=Bacillus amyloliquefaciens group TaxID=1938374 RepID=UPI0003965D47|nr:MULTISPECIES: hypothetical protein [Bacillus amyloliquefaciens group]ERH59239.1 hypothetical protein O205_01120 [Bacillus amyloliquefaciens EGD-AQ14]MDH3075637.1 hypothetical protein [Bacillus velezensis]MDH3102735.1 hypothetical protein [Bacillus velezensis]MDH3107143.1 hypothetical protein [Bacillus velezensis]MDH3135629.1 hypothetical protein [Bacillus velezensis]